MSLQNGAFKKAYFEITNVCNAACTFCPGNSREPKFVTDEEFDIVLANMPYSQKTKHGNLYDLPRYFKQINED